MNRLFHTFDRLVVERSGGLEIQKRPGAMFVMVGAVGAVAALLALAGRALRGSESMSGSGWFCMGAARLLVVVAMVALVAAAFMALYPPARVYCRLDPRREALIRGRRVTPFASIEAFRIAPFQGSWISLVAAVRGGRPIMLLTTAPAARPALEDLAQRFSALLARTQGGPAGSESAAVDLGPETTRLFVVVAIVTGVLWTTLGYFFFAGLYFSSRLESAFRIPVWCLGPVFLAVGAWTWVSRRRQ